MSADMSSTSSGSSSLSSLNSQLMTHGWAKRPLNIDALSEKDQNEVVAVMYELLGSSVTNLDALENLSSRSRTLQYENERVLKGLGNARASQARLESEVSHYKARCVEMERKLAAAESKTKELREEINRGRKTLEGVRVAAGHENRKVQIKLDSALGKLAKISSDASILARPQGIYLCNPIPSSRNAPVAVGQAPLLEQSLRDLSEVRESLQEESEAFRHVILSTANSLRDILSFAAGKDTPQRLIESQFWSVDSSTNTKSRNKPSKPNQNQTYQSPPSITHPGIADDKLRILLNQVRAKLSEKIIHVSSDLGATESPDEIEEKKRIEREVEKRRMDLEDRVKDLEVEIVCAKGREDEAKKALEEFMKVQMKEKVGGNGSEIVAEEVDRLGLSVERREFEEERRQHGKLVAKLEKERRHLEVEREAFLAERRKADVDDMLAFFPPTPPAATTSASSSSSSIAKTSSSNTSSSSGSFGSGTSGPAVTTNNTSKPPMSPRRPTWESHRPASPSPLRNASSPKSHTVGAGKKKARTPLSRLVLEKAVRAKGKEKEVESQRSPIKNVLGESGRRGNVSSGSGATSKVHMKGSKGVESMMGKEKAVNTEGLSKSIGLTKSALGVDKSKMAVPLRKADLSKSAGIGPSSAAKGAKQWR